MQTLVFNILAMILAMLPTNVIFPMAAAGLNLGAVVLIPVFGGPAGILLHGMLHLAIL